MVEGAAAARRPPARHIIIRLARRLVQPAAWLALWLPLAAAAQAVAGTAAVERAALYPQGVPEASRRLELDLAWLPAAGWRPQEILPALRGVAAALAHCRVVIGSARLVEVDAPPRYLDFSTMRSRELAAALGLRRPTLWFVRDSQQPEPFEAEAIGRGNSRSRPELADSVWVTRGARDLPLVLAHELVHVLSDSGEHVEEPGNLMNPETAAGNTGLSDAQCERLRDAGSRNGLLQPLE